MHLLYSGRKGPYTMALTLILDFLKNPLFLSAVFSWLAAQLIKLIIQLVSGGETGRLLTGGGISFG